jgi:hypothetical protein
VFSLPSYLEYTTKLSGSKIFVSCIKFPLESFGNPPPDTTTNGFGPSDVHSDLKNRKVGEVIVERGKDGERLSPDN